MDTVRLRAIQKPSRVERLLVSFAVRSGIMGADAYMVRDQSAIPTELRAVIVQTTRKGHTWCCWADGSRFWLLTGDIPLALSRRHGSPVLNVELYGRNGEMEDNDLWVLDMEGTWRRAAKA